MRKQIMSRTARCNSCQGEHEIYGAPGQEVTASFVCPCGNRIRLTTTFPPA